MRIFPILLCFNVSVGSAQEKPLDPCNELCSREGKFVCTHGSTLSINGVCSNYYFRTASRTDHCYTLSSTPSCTTNFPMTGNAAVRRIQILRYNQRLVAGKANVIDEQDPNEYITTGLPFLELSSPRLRRATPEVTPSAGDIFIEPVVADLRNVPDFEEYRKYRPPYRCSNASTEFGQKAGGKTCNNV